MPTRHLAGVGGEAGDFWVGLNGWRERGEGL